MRIFLTFCSKWQNFERLKNREDSSDLDENLTESIAAMRSIISQNFVGARARKKCFLKFFRAIRCLNIYRCLYALLSSYRNDSIYSGAPEGLIATRYFGDAFWDVETLLCQKTFSMELRTFMFSIENI